MFIFPVKTIKPKQRHTKHEPTKYTVLHNICNVPKIIDFHIGQSLADKILDNVVHKNNGRIG